MKKLVFSFVLLIACAASLSAQMSREDLEEAFKYFPAGACDSIAHVNDVALAGSSIFTKYRAAFKDDFGTPGLELLPPALRKGVFSRSKANRLRLMKFSDSHVQKTKTNRGISYSLTKDAMKTVEGEVSGTIFVPDVIDGKSVVSILANVAWQYRVYRYDNLDPGIAEALKTGQVTPFDTKLTSRPVYQFSYIDHRRKKLDLLAYATSNNELLVALNLKMLKEMIDAGDGSTTNLMEDGDYRDVLLDLNGYMTESWDIWFTSTLRKLRLERMKKNSGDSEQMKLMEKELACGLSYQFTAESFKGNYRMLEKLYRSDMPASEAFGFKLLLPWSKSKLPQDIKDLKKELGAKFIHSIDEEKNIMTISRVHGENTLEKQIRINKATRKLRAQYEAEQAKKEAANSN